MPQKRRRKSTQTTPSLRPWLWVACALALAGIAVLRWAESGPGRMILADRGVPSARGWARREVENRLLDALERAGVSADSILVSSPDRSRRVTLRATSALGFIPLNLAVSEAVDAVGGRVHWGVRHEGRGGDTLELEVGTREHVTHRVLLQRGAAPIEPPPSPQGRLAIVIDDWGHNLAGPARRLLNLPAPLTIAILPNLRYSRRILTEANRAGKRTLLHLPMEPEPGGDTSPGEQAISVDMSEGEIHDLTAALLDGMNGVCGVNNHMGSRATQYPVTLRPVMEVLARRGLFFLDSVTTPQSIAYRVARERGVPAARNDLFLDDDTEDPDLVEARLWKLVELARRYGHAVGIGHVNEATATALERVLPRLLPDDVQLVPLDDLVHALPPARR
ncbi:MAG TPA: divergent polysaccharide deacetylase family protein [Candidatus Krumholzibacteria bacterium]